MLCHGICTQEDNFHSGHIIVQVQSSAIVSNGASAYPPSACDAGKGNHFWDHLLNTCLPLCQLCSATAFVGSHRFVKL